MTDTLAACQALLKDAVAEIEALRRKQAYLANAWKDHAENLRRHAVQAELWGHVGEQIRSEERAQMFEDRVRELGGVG